MIHSHTHMWDRQTDRETDGREDLRTTHNRNEACNSM